MILQETLDKIYSLKIEEVIGDFVQLKRSGSNFKGLSPFTTERTPSFMVSPVKQIFKCFSSGKGGNVVTFIREHEHLSFYEAAKYLANKYGIPFLETAKTEAEIALDLQKESMYIMNVFVNDFFYQRLKSDPGALHYVMQQRGINQSMIDKFSIGFAPDSFSEFSSILIQNQYDWKIAIQCSLVGLSKNNHLYDRFRNRLMFPIRNISGNLIGFGGRYLGIEKEVAKYLNSNDSIIYNKSETLYGIFESRKSIAEKDHAFLVEGYTDVVSFHQKSVENVISTCGTSLTVDQAKLIRRFAKKVTVIFDGDSPGLKATIRSIDVLLQEGLSVYVCLLPTGEDPDSFAQKHEHQQIISYIETNSKDFLMFKLNYFNTIAGDDLTLKSAAIVEVANSVSKIPDAIQREVYIKECARVTDISINSIRELVNKANKELIDILPTQEFETQINITRLHVKEQCEKRILQYLLCYRNEILPFKNLYIAETGEESVIENISVLEKIKTEVIPDEIEFSNIMYEFLFSHFTKDLPEPLVDAEMILAANNLIAEEIEMTKNVFAADKSKGEILSEMMKNNLANAISETLIYNKILFVSDMIDQELKMPEIDREKVFELLQFNYSLKNILNFV